jgi:hypothetical protein
MNQHQRLDATIGVVYPWYTWTCLDVLSTWDVSHWDVFEYGAGYSTSWWRCKAASVTGVDNNPSWASRFRVICHTEKDAYVHAPLETGRRYDCIVIDGEPVEWRDECTEIALQCLKPGGKLIIDNWKQSSVDLADWPQTEKLLQSIPCNVYYQPGHRDWKTAVWTIPMER